MPFSRAASWEQAMRGLVEKTYEYLLGKRPDTGLLLRCCGAPAEWSGDEEKFGREIETIYKLWDELGKPTC